MNEIDDIWGGWFSGFSDGEGSFAIEKNGNKNPRTDYNCRFTIALRDDDQAILEEIRDRLGIGFIYDGPARFTHGRNAQAQTIFRVNSINECAELVKFFETYPLRAKKQQDFEVWKQAVVELVKPVNHRDPDLFEYFFLKIREVRQYEKREEITKPKIKEIQLIIKFQEEEFYEAL